MRQHRIDKEKSDREYERAYTQFKKYYGKTFDIGYKKYTVLGMHMYDGESRAVVSDASLIEHDTWTDDGYGGRTTSMKKELIDWNVVINQVASN